MFGLGMGELIVILAIALIFLGPKRLPDVATSLGKAIRSFRKATRELTDQLEIDDDVKAPLRELQSALRDDPAPQQLAVMKTPAPAEPKPIAAAASAAPSSAATTAPSPSAPKAAVPPPLPPTATPDKK